MTGTLDTCFLFRFTDAEGAFLTRHVYWEHLYAVRCGDETVLVSSRVVPHNDPFYALYLVLRSHLEPEAGPAGVRESKAVALVKRAAGLIARQRVSLPPTALKQADELLAEAMSQSLARYRLSPPDGSDLARREREEWEPANPWFPLASGPSREDVAWVLAGDQLFAQIQKDVQSVVRSTAGTLAEDHALVPARQVALQAFARIYGNPECLAVVKRVMEARGGFVSSLVRHFVGFCYDLLRRKRVELPGLPDPTSPFWEQQFEGVLGRAEAEAQGLPPHHEIMVLGSLASGDVRPNPEDPQHTGRGFQVDPALDPQSLLLREVTGAVRRLAVRTAVRYGVPCSHIQRVHFADEE